jgi:hypothetical protein
MYAQSVIDEKLSCAAKYLGWTPEYHSIEEVDRFGDHMKGLLEERENRDIELKRDLTKKEVWWIRNERAICKADAMYFKTRYAYICNEEGETLRYIPRRSQIIFNQILSEFDAKQVAIELQILKGRQLGVSTEVQCDFAHRCMFISGVNAVSASVNSQKSELMSNMTKTLVQNMPWYMVPQLNKFKWSGNQGMIGFEHGSRIAIQSGAQSTGIAQGWTVTCAHISEVCDYPNPKNLIEEGLFRAIHTSRKVFLVLESTGNGDSGWWAETWRSSKEFYHLGRARLYPLFLPWFVGDDIYPKSDWLKQHPIPDGWRPGPDTLKHAIKCTAYVRNTSVLQRVFGADWELPRPQMWFWEFNYDEAKRKRAAKEWLRQMPADDKEALSGKNDKVLPYEITEEMYQERRPYQVYGIIGEGIDEKNEPDPSIVDYGKPRFLIHWRTPKDIDLEWMFLPLLPFDETDEASSLNKLLLWEEPIDGCEYAMSGDTAEGGGGDRSVFNINRIDRHDGPDIQVAEFASDSMSTAEAAYIAAALLAWFSPAVPNYKCPLIAIEQRRKPGDDCQNQLIRLGFRRHFRFHRLDGKNTDEEERRSTRLGWYTNEWSRPYMFGRLLDAIENGWYRVNSPFAIQELASLEKKFTATGKSRLEHMDGKKDDRVFALGISYVIPHTKDVRIEREKKRYDMPKGKKPPIDLSGYNPDSFTVSDPDERLNA